MRKVFVILFAAVVMSQSSCGDGHIRELVQDIHKHASDLINSPIESIPEKFSSTFSITQLYGEETYEIINKNLTTTGIHSIRIYSRQGSVIGMVFAVLIETEKEFNAFVSELTKIYGKRVKDNSDDFIWIPKLNDFKVSISKYEEEYNAFSIVLLTYDPKI